MRSSNKKLDKDLLISSLPFCFMKLNPELTDRNCFLCWDLLLTRCSLGFSPLPCADILGVMMLPPLGSSKQCLQGWGVLMDTWGPVCLWEECTYVCLTEGFPDRQFCLWIARVVSLHVGLGLLGYRTLLCFCSHELGPEYREKPVVNSSSHEEGISTPIFPSTFPSFTSVVLKLYKVGKSKTNLSLPFADEMLLPCGPLYMQGSAQSSGCCLSLVRKAAGRWAVNLEVERRCAAIAISLQFPWEGTAHLLHIQCSAQGYRHQLEKAIKHEPPGAPPGRHEFVLVLFFVLLTWHLQLVGYQARQVLGLRGAWSCSCIFMVLSTVMLISCAQEVIYDQIIGLIICLTLQPTHSCTSLSTSRFQAILKIIFLFCFHTALRLLGLEQE